MNESKLAREEIDRWIGTIREEFQTRLAEWVAIPSISMDPSRASDIRRQVDVAAAAFRAWGAEVEVIETSGNPVLHARFDVGPGCPTVTIYNHLDVQPATEPEWRTDPFVLRADGDTWYGRGSTDDKGPALTALYAAHYAHEAGMPINIRFLWECEEEIGSPSLEPALVAAGSRLATDSVAVCDTIWISRGRPAVATGLRGTQGLRIVLQTGETDQHSGVTGGAARNPIGELAWLVSEMYDARSGACHIPGFMDDVIPPSKEELDGFRKSGFNVSGFMKDHLFRSLRTKDPEEVMRRIWALPTFEVHGIVGGYTGPGVKTIIPPKAEVKISIRLVPRMDPVKIMKALKAFVKSRIPDAVIDVEAPLAPYRGVTTGPYAEAACEAFRFGFGRAPAFVREGGSIGAVLTMEKRLAAPVMFIGLSLPEHGYHAPNENFDWGQASGGIRTFVKYFEQLARMGKGGAEEARRAMEAASADRRRPATRKSTPKKHAAKMAPRKGSAASRRPAPKKPAPSKRKK
jgi:acetylornithine deacetylase/succinyl-diaminopimelate desuccinylase-like protein